MYDLIIIGMGIAGISASIYAKRSNLKILCLEEKMIGGTLNYIDRIDNYPGLSSINGSAFVYKLIEQLQELEIEYKLESVKNIIKSNEIFEITTLKNKYLAKKILVTTGRSPKKINIENEEKFLGRGISYCAVCDGAFFKNKDVAVVGGGQSALSEALYLANVVNKVYLIHRKNKFSAQASIVDKVVNNPKINILYEEEIKSILGNEYLERIELKSGKLISVSGLFVYIGYTPTISYLKEFDIFDDEGYIAVNSNYETKTKGIYAAGDIVKKEFYQLIIAASEGAKAALEISKSINN